MSLNIANDRQILKKGLKAPLKMVIIILKNILKMMIFSLKKPFLYVNFSVFRMGFYKLPAWRNLISHQHTKHTVGLC